MNQSYELKKTLKTVKEIAVSSISTAEDINDTIHVIVDYRVGIYPFMSVLVLNNNFVFTFGTFNAIVKGPLSFLWPWI